MVVADAVHKKQQKIKNRDFVIIETITSDCDISSLHAPINLKMGQIIHYIIYDDHVVLNCSYYHVVG